MTFELKSRKRGLSARSATSLKELKNIKAETLVEATEVAQQRLIEYLEGLNMKLQNSEDGRYLEAINPRTGKVTRGINILPIHTELLEEQPQRVVQIFDQRGKDFSEVLKEINQDLLVKVDYKNKRILHKKNNTQTYFWIWVK